MLGTQEIILIVLAIILLFGATKIPELARSIGKAKGEFNRGKYDLEDEMNVKKPSMDIKSSDEKSLKIRKMAEELGIEIEGNTDEQLLDKIKKRMPKINNQ